MRTDDDSWDIITGVGATALVVAAARSAESRRQDALIHDRYAALFVHEIGSQAWNTLADGDESWMDNEARIESRRFNNFIAGRTRYFDDYLSQAVAAGVRQIVLLASGLDARAYRLDLPNGTSLYELDQPEVLQFKRATLAKNSVHATVDRREVAIDLRHDWPSALVAAGFDSSAPAAWLAEGLLLYLPGHAQDQLFDRIIGLSAPGSRFSTNIFVDEAKLPDTANKGTYLHKLGINLNVHELRYSHDERSDPFEWFAAHGWVGSHTSVAAELAILGRTYPPELTEHMARHSLITAVLTH
ncbi:SAM-dependent methyltransferase [Mycobacteroides abscessus]|uniref:SAM-dependent methyltransferase n=1 Tax=Mycobacteroides abscessus TaxID=36809 RepID=UPI00078D9B8E|nr:class I SAM-dependent methyltransferase [Mycobacteroides abscessus]AMU75781.1 hypothetical protein A3O06_15010 [Mycobacteroides abscessus]ANO24726.1 hypothetical protein BAB79_15005 [Mycobacteroides abscessus]